MERKIKFKALSNGEWVYGQPVKSILGNWKMYNDGNISFIDPDTICQYTGFNDIEGNEVYEGDICTIKNSTKAVVEWKDYAFRLLSTTDDVNGRRTEYCLSRLNQIQVIGNIHDK